MTKAEFDITVNWEASVNEAYKETSADVRRQTGIKRYRVYGGPIGGYSVLFETDETYHYYFYDETGDWYGCNVFVTSWPHYVNYSSDRPNIVRITGS
ncbi:MAG: hypothetical protein J3Q66DRAFT_337487 [Benniella sp.]|nr:MAG: hypothetical protein J3Q66DRAFT_337487 [Benniella sp.]